MAPGMWKRQQSGVKGVLSLIAPTESSSVALNPLNVYDCYNFDVVLGKGHFGVTYLVYEKATDLQWACKTINKRKLATEADMNDIRREIQIMKHMTGHPNIVKLKDVFEDEEYIYMVLELCSGGELFQRIVQKTFYSERDAAGVMRTMLEVVAHLHAMGVVHRDLKPENILLSDETPDALLKTIDFGLSMWVIDGQDLTDVVGSPYYVAPEVLRKSHNKEVDVWSCGVMLYILLCGWPPFWGNTVQEVLDNVLHMDLDLTSSPWNKISAAAKDIVGKMLIKDPAERISVQDALMHPWMVKNGVAPSEPLKVEVLERMKHFTTLNRFQKQIVRILVQHCSPDDVAGMRQMFRNMDSDADGYITVNDLINGLERRGANVAEGEIKDLINSMDLDGSNSIDVQEFLASTANQQLLNREENLLRTFQKLDKDGSGFISKTEVMTAVNEMRDSSLDVLRIMEGADKNGDGRIDYEEFCNMMRNRQQSDLHHAASDLHHHIRPAVLDKLGTITPRKARSKKAMLPDASYRQPPAAVAVVPKVITAPDVVDITCCNWRLWSKQIAAGFRN